MRYIFTKRRKQWPIAAAGLTVLLALVVLLAAAGCIPVVVVQAKSVTASDALQKTVPAGDRSSPLRSVCPLSSQPSATMVCAVHTGVVPMGQFNLYHSDIR
ncbi:MAG: hypothetical protein [Microviridae sp.]|nr:MAG: hypothetical protein [Microviridae sp.]